MTPTQHIERMTPLLHIMAAERVRPGLHDDAVQEARIAVWQVVEKHAADPRPLGPLLTVVARRAVMAVAQGRPMTGEQGRRGVERDPLRVGQAAEYDPAKNDAAIDDHADAVAARVDVDELLAGLAPWERAYVIGCYIEDRSVTDVASELGMSRSAANRAWVGRIRPALLERLSARVDSGV